MRTFLEPSRLVLVAGLGVGVLAVSGRARSEEVPPQKPGYETDVARPVDKIRTGSMLHKEEEVTEVVDARTMWMKKRDFAVTKHVQRVAEFDAIAAVAQTAGDVELQERVEDVRRKELQRYYAEMQALQAELRQLRQGGAGQ